MPTEIIMPALGMAQDTGKLIGWLKQEGEAVNKGDALFEVETDKVTVEIEAAASGTLATVSARAGDDVPVGQVIAYLVQPGEDIPEPSPIGAVEALLPQPEAESKVTNGIAAQEHQVTVSPVAARMAAIHDVDLSLINAGGRRIMKADVERFLNENSSTPAPVKMVSATASSSTMADKWRSTPHITLRRDVPVQSALDWCETAGLSLMDVILTACATALPQHPQANAYWHDGQVYQYDRIHLGFTMPDEHGSHTLVLTDADQQIPAALADQRKSLIQAFQSGSWHPADYPHSTFTVGRQDAVDNFNPVLDAPQAGYLAVGRVIERIIPSANGPIIQPMVTLALTADHRVLDGARTAQLLNAIIDYIQQPLALLS